MADPKLPTAPTQDEPIEWIGGCVADLDFEEANDSTPPAQLIAWLDGEGNLVSTGSSAAVDLAEATVEGLQAVMEREDAPPRPDRVRVAVPEMAEALRAAYPNIEVICAPTPELEAIPDLLMSLSAEAFQSPAFELEDLGALFRAAGILFRAEPWTQTPDEQMILSITIEEMELYNAVLLVSGQEPQDFVFLLFESADEFQKHVDNEIGAYPNEEEAPRASYFGFKFSSEDDLSPEELDVVREAGWEVASPIAYPSIVGFEGKSLRPFYQLELIIAEKVALTLAQFMVKETEVTAAWLEDNAVHRTYVVHSCAGELEASICVPYPSEPSSFDFNPSLIEELTALSMGDGGIDHELRVALQEDLLLLFEKAPESQELNSMGHSRTVMDLCADSFGKTIPTVDADVMSRVLFELFPHKICIEADAATDIILELRAFFRFLKRAFDLDRADACLRVLSGDAIDRLEDELSNPTNFDRAKTLYMEGVAAGYDMKSEEGMKEWMSVLLTRQRPTPSAPNSAPKNAFKAKKKRKAARKARKKNR